MYNRRSQFGQSLMEVVVVVAVAVIVIGALTFATIASLRNAQFAKNQAQATKLAQEVLERVRAGRDRNSKISDFSFGAGSGDNIVSSWSDEDMWDDQISQNCILNCYFVIDSTGALTNKGAGSIMPSSIIEVGGFRQAVILSDQLEGEPPAYTIEKIVTAQVLWTDFSGEHESRLTTILRKI